MGTEPSALPTPIVEEALTRAINGDGHGGGMLLVPLIEESRFSCFALCVMLATAARAGMGAVPGHSMVILQVEDVETGEPTPVEDMPDDVVFAAHFTAAWANEDRATAQALFDALAADLDTETGMCRLVDGVLALYGMAIATSARSSTRSATPAPRKKGTDR